MFAPSFPAPILPSLHMAAYIGGTMFILCRGLVTGCLMVVRRKLMSALAERYFEMVISLLIRAVIRSYVRPGYKASDLSYPSETRERIFLPPPERLMIWLCRGALLRRISPRQSVLGYSSG